jgi:hypothetical protein
MHCDFFNDAFSESFVTQREMISMITYYYYYYYYYYLEGNDLGLRYSGIRLEGLR